MTANYYQKHKEKLQNKAREGYQNISEEKKIKGEKRPETDMKVFLKKIKKQVVSIIVDVIRIFLRNKSKLSL